MKYITESLADALLRRRYTEEPAPEPTSKKVNEEVDDDETLLPDDVVVADIEDSNVDIEDDKVEEQEVKESVEDDEETDVESEGEQTEASVDESVEEEVEIIGESINYKKIANDILDDWDKLVNKGGSDNMKKAVMTYVKKNKNKIDFEDFDYDKFDKEAQNIVDKGEASANKDYKKGSVPWYDMDAQMGLGNSHTVDDGDWWDWFDDALNESIEEPTRKFYSIDEDRWITIKGTHVLVDDNGGIKNEKLKDKIEDSKPKKEEKKEESKPKKHKNHVLDIDRNMSRMSHYDEMRFNNALKKEYGDSDDWSVDDFIKSVAANCETTGEVIKQAEMKLKRK